MKESEIRYHISELRNKAKLLDDSGFATTGISKNFRISADIIEELLESRTKFIDEFVERLQDKVESFQAEINGFRADVLTLDYFTEFVDEVAEEMKGGAE